MSKLKLSYWFGWVLLKENSFNGVCCTFLGSDAKPCTNNDLELCDIKLANTDNRQAATKVPAISTTENRRREDNLKRAAHGCKFLLVA